MIAKSLVIRMDGTFDAAAAAEIQETIAEAPQGSEIYVDLSQVRDFHDRAVASLAEAVKRTPHPISVRGLRQHQYRMLRYLGVDAGALDPGLGRRPRTASAAEEADLQKT